MADDLDGVRDDIAAFRAMLADDAKLREFAVEHCDIVSDEDDARLYVGTILRSLDDILEGRVVPHDDVARRYDTRGRQAGLDAAE